MKLLSGFLFLLFSTALLSVTACQPDKSPMGPQGPPNRSEKEIGSSSGGGGFVDENSTRILDTAAKGLAKMIRYSSPGIYAHLPKGMTQEKLADLIEHIRYEPMQERSREGRDLMFDYVNDQDTYLVALKPFFVAYSSYPIKFVKGESLMNLMQDVRLKIAHEVAHLLGIGIQIKKDSDAEEFGVRLINALNSDMIHCEALDIGTWPVPALKRGFEPPPGAKRWNWIWHRPSGFGLFLSTDNWDCCENSDAYSREVSYLFNGGLVKRHIEPIVTGRRVVGNEMDREYARQVYNSDLSLTKEGRLELKAQIPEVPTANFELVTIPNQSVANPFSGEFSYSLSGTNPSQKSFPLKCEAHFETLEFNF